MSNIVNKDFCFSSCTKECTDFLVEKATKSLLEILDKAETIIKKVTIINSK